MWMCLGSMAATCVFYYKYSVALCENKQNSAIGAGEQQLWQQDTDWDVDVPTGLLPFLPWPIASPPQIPRVISYACQRT